VKEYARTWKAKPRLVFSTTLQEVGWNSKLVRGNVAEEVAKLKAQPGNDMSVGGAGLAASFMQLDLIDEYWLYVYPILLGGGKPMFPDLPDRLNLRLLETRAFNRGAVLLRYERAGKYHFSI
jgi:dihydrofolate reductase